MLLRQILALNLLKMSKRNKIALLLTPVLFSLTAFLVHAQTVQVGTPITIQPPVIQQTIVPNDWKPPVTFGEGQTDIKSTSLTITDFSLYSKGVYPGNSISGSFTIENGSPFLVDGVKYAVFIANKNKLAAPYYLPAGINLAYSLDPYLNHRYAAEQIFSESLRIPQGNFVSKNFSYAIPMGLNAGDYIVWIAAQPERGQLFTSSDLSLKILGKSQEAIDISDIIIKNPFDAGYVPYGGIMYFNPGDNLELIYNIKSFIPATISFKPHVQIRSHSLLGPITQEFDFNSFEVTKGSQSATLGFSVKQSGKYFGAITFSGSINVKDKNGIAQNKDIGQFPFVSIFSFILKGDQAEIQTIYTENGKLAVQVQGPQYPNADLGNVTVKISATDLSNNNAFLTDQKDTPLTGTDGKNPVATTYFDLPQNLPQFPRYEASVYKGTALLDKYSIEPQGGAPNQNQAVVPQSLSSNIMLIIIGLIALLAIGFGWFYYRKNTMVNKIGLFLVIVGASFVLFGASQTHAALIWDYVPSYPLGNYTWWGGPADGSSFGPGQPMNVGSGRTSPGWLPNTSNCKMYSTVSAPGVAVISDGAPSNPKTLNTANVDSQFASTNYAKFWLSGNTTWGYNRDCTLWFIGSSGGSFNTPTTGSKGTFFGKPVNVYVIDYIAGWQVGHVTVTITPLSYSLNVNPLTRTIGVGQTANFDITVLPASSTYPYIAQPPIFDYEAPYPLGTNHYMDNPVNMNGYKPGDTITFSAGRQSDSQWIGTSACSRISGFGGSLAVAVISDGAPQDVTKLSIQNIPQQFAGTNYRSLGILNSTLQLGYNNDCTVWFQARAWGTKTIPSSGSICTASGSLNTFNGPVNAYIIFQGDAGSFVAHQIIRVGPGMSPSPPPIMSIFNAPVTLSLPSGIPGLSSSFYNVSWSPGSTATADPITNAYAPTTLGITAQSITSNQEICPAVGPDGTACSDPWGIEQCYDTSGDWCGPATWGPVTTPPPVGTYTFNVQGLSSGPIAGIQKLTPQLSLIISNTPPPQSPTITPSGNTCPPRLTWNAVTFDPTVPGPSGYKVLRIAPDTTNPFTSPPSRQVLAVLPATQTSYIDNSASGYNYYIYEVDSFNGNGSNPSNLLPMLLGPTCQPGPPPPPTPSLSTSCSPSSPSITNGSSVTWSANVSGGNPPYTYSWSGDNGLTGTGPSVSWTYNLPTGSSTVVEKADIVVQDSSGASGSGSCSVTVGKTKIIEVNPGP